MALILLASEVRATTPHQ